MSDRIPAQTHLTPAKLEALQRRLALYARRRRAAERWYATGGRTPFPAPLKSS